MLLLRRLGDEVMLALVVLREPCDRVILSHQNSFGHEYIMVCSNGVKIVSEAEIHQANAILNKCLVQLQSNMRPRGEEANSMGINLETAQELNYIAWFGCRIVFIFLPFGSSAPSIMYQSHGFTGPESAPVDLLEVLYIDSGVVHVEAKKCFIACMVV